MTQRSEVLLVNEGEERDLCMQAVSDMIRNILVEDRTTLAEIAKRTSISIGTISNAFNKKSSLLNAAYISRLSTAYGCYTLEPYAALSGGRVIPREQTGTADILPLMTMTTARIAAARDPASPGGIVENLHEQLGYLPDLKRLYRDLGALICRVEARRAAA